MRASKIITNLVLTAAGLLVVALLSLWSYVSTQVAHVTFSKDRYCELQFHQWYSGRAVLSYYENGACVGHVQLNNDLFNDPMAMFPGPDGKSVVCVSWPDTFEAVFTIDFAKRRSEGVVIPERLKLDGQEAVDFSNFEVRACNANEVKFVRQFIQSSDIRIFADCTRWGRRGQTESLRSSMLNFFTQATSLHDWGDPVLRNASPLILPENQSVSVIDHN